MDEVVILLASGTKGMRYATKHAMICPNQLVNNQPFQTNLNEAESFLKRTTADNKICMNILAEATGKSVKTIMKDFERKQFMDAKQALKYGLIDAILPSKK